jgi:hypothetical protein
MINQQKRIDVINQDQDGLVSLRARLLRVPADGLVLLLRLGLTTTDGVLVIAGEAVERSTCSTVLLLGLRRYTQGGAGSARAAAAARGIAVPAERVTRRKARVSDRPEMAVPEAWRVGRHGSAR